MLNINFQANNNNSLESGNCGGNQVFRPRVKIDFAVGGQAVIEGVMMRSPNFITVAVRKNGDFIKVKEESFRALAMRINFFGIPLLRGVINLFEMMIIGMRMLNFSAGEFVETEDERNQLSSETDKEKVDPRQNTLTANSKTLARTEKKSQADSQVSSTDKNSFFSKFGAFLSFAFSIVFALGMSLFLFKFLPLLITDFLSTKLTLAKENYLIFNLIDGTIKMTFFVLYIAIIGLMPSMHRVFQYHGAEHKSIYTYEKGLALNVENAKKMTRFHPRCGTSFILVVFLISIFIYTFVPRQPDFMMNFLLRVAFLPLVAGVSYEILKWSAKHAEHSLVKIITLPGLLFQRITTQEPDDEQLEVALNALRRALELEELHMQKMLKADVP